MEIIYLFIVIATFVVVGIWVNSSKEHSNMIKNASFIRTFFLLLLSAWCLFFYYKSNQIATFKNKIEIKSQSGKYYDEIDSLKKNVITYDHKINSTTTLLNHWTDTYMKYIGNLKSVNNKLFCDTVKSLVLLSCFKNTPEGFSNYSKDFLDNFNKNFFQRDFWSLTTYSDSNYQNMSCIRAFVKINEYYHKKNGNTKELYRLEFSTNTIPQLFPFIKYKKDNPYTLSQHADSSKRKTVIGIDYDRFFSQSIRQELKPLDSISYEEKRRRNKQQEGMIIPDDSTSYRALSRINEFINNLNFFSATDLSQCEYKVEIHSDIPIERFYMYFNIPVEISSIDVTKKHRHYNYREGFDMPEITTINPINNNISSRGFSIQLEQGDNDKIDCQVHFIASLPTLANLQLIRTLILTMLLTALLPLTLANLYFYSRKIFINLMGKIEKYGHIKRHLWIPVGKILLLTFCVIIAYLLYLSITNNPFVIDIYHTKQLVNDIRIGVVIYIIIIVDVMYLLYKKDIYISSIKDRLKMIKQIFWNRIKKFMK